MEPSKEEKLLSEQFNQLVSKNLKTIINARENRPLPPKGMRYKRDWYDKIQNKHLTDKYFLDNIKDIWDKKSNIPREERNFIDYICRISLNEAINNIKNSKL